MEISSRIEKVLVVTTGVLPTLMLLVLAIGSFSSNGPTWTTVLTYSIMVLLLPFVLAGWYMLVWCVYHEAKKAQQTRIHNNIEEEPNIESAASKVSVSRDID